MPASITAIHQGHLSDVNNTNSFSKYKAHPKSLVKTRYMCLK
jgi:hypothetical protein